MMKQESLFKKLGTIVTELNEHYQYLAQNPQQINELELELLQANANFLVDHIQIVKKMIVKENTVNTEHEEKEEPKEEILNVPVQPVLTEDEPVEEKTDAVKYTSAEEQEDIHIVDEEPVFEKEIFSLETEPEKTFEFVLNTEYSADDKFDFEEKNADELFDRALSEEEQKILEQKKKVKENLIRNTEELEEDEIGPEPFLIKEEEPIVIPVEEEQPQALTELTVQVEKTEIEIPVQQEDYRPTLNDMLASKGSASINNSQQNLNPIADLKQGISLNDKLLFIKDLFNGYNLAYAEAIELANKLPDFEAADQFFKVNYAAKNNWADKQSTVDKFYNVLNQRFKQ
ncbi:hypothetical protein [Pedobacter montanisoli]|uniref:Uncharacterized protein n=1 Tax=Pedobacter montanisoli TaxID=2923277 RepID=A0ABS9ZWP9_9SPHI|nr:hypothetical protein [Pedobacter montanisoli]MCJ0742736.1 hypothetical protein [Pedobacter montanisoli]